MITIWRMDKCDAILILILCFMLYAGMLIGKAYFSYNFNKELEAKNLTLCKNPNYIIPIYNQQPLNYNKSNINIQILNLTNG